MDPHKSLSSDLQANKKKSIDKICYLHICGLHILKDYNSMVESKIMESDLKCVPVLVAFEAAEARDGAEEEEEARGA